MLELKEKHDELSSVMESGVSSERLLPLNALLLAALHKNLPAFPENSGFVRYKVKRAPIENYIVYFPRHR